MFTGARHDTDEDRAEIKTTGNSHYTYYQVLRNFDHDTISYSDFYLKLLHAREDLLSDNSNITFKGVQYVTDSLSQYDIVLGQLHTDQSDFVLDWMRAIGGPAFRGVYSSGAFDSFPPCPF